jgi:hypothetical protein|tara:strand:+ start:45 stop:290 length:246 start_codon:yes stop_codon:yes gene_type:complete
VLDATSKNIEWKRSQRKPNPQGGEMGLYERIKRCKTMKEFERLVLCTMIFEHDTNPYPQRYVDKCQRAMKRKDKELSNKNK